MAVTTVVQWAYLRTGKGGVGRAVLALAVIASAAGTAVMVVLAGESGARAVWESK
jgi:hypothetical protein